MKQENKPIKKEEVVKVDIFDVLTDEENCTNIYMYNDKGEQLEFEQIAVIPYAEQRLYCILKPVSYIPGIKEDEAVVFEVCFSNDDEGSYLKVEEDEKIAIEIFNEYYDLVEEGGENQ